MRRIASTILVATIAAVVAASANAAIAPDGVDAKPKPRLPRCVEDAVLVGVGSFENGRWSSYECGPSVDDYFEIGF